MNECAALGTSPDPEARIAATRRDYDSVALEEADLADDPMTQFNLWFGEAIDGGVIEPAAMVVGTADAAGRPSSRTVLLKDYDAEGFVFYTNYTSRKAAELSVNSAVSLLFPWYEVHRQVIVMGDAERVDRATSAAYWATRPRGSQLSAWASRQSSEVASRDELVRRRNELELRFSGGEVPLPEFWGGWRIRPSSVEFWQGRLDRLHDRLRFTRADGGWRVARLCP